MPSRREPLPDQAADLERTVGLGRHRLKIGSQALKDPVTADVLRVGVGTSGLEEKLVRDLVVEGRRDGKLPLEIPEEVSRGAITLTWPGWIVVAQALVDVGT